ncbi:MAG TPA: CGNR zinc finger domain-containing protein [Dehalococcoidia bacterium]|jgi:predicted RNA-binding Zn ribbon-like protein
MPNRPSAPGALALVQAFVNTLDVETGSDELRDPAALRSWLTDRDLLEPNVALGPAQLRRALELREALRELLSANHPGHGQPQAEAVDAVNALAGGAPLRLHFEAAGGATLQPGSTGMEGAVARLLGIVYTAMVEGTWRRLKVCRADRCRWAFYDASKNRSGAWCAMQVCGNRTKVRAYQRRRRSGAGAEQPAPS